MSSESHILNNFQSSIEDLEVDLQKMTELTINNLKASINGLIQRDSAACSSVIASDEYKNLPHRDEYAETANIMADTPHAEKYGAIQDLIGNNLIAILTGNKEMDATLKDVQNKMKKLLR